jgi:hypothetical protein
MGNIALKMYKGTINMDNPSNTFPPGVDTLTTLLDMLAGWQEFIASCREWSDEDLTANNTTRDQWEAHHSEAYLDHIANLYQDAGRLTDLVIEEQPKAVERFVLERIVPLFKTSSAQH